MRIIFYSTDNLHGMLFLILEKGLKQGTKFNVFFSTEFECEDFSRAFWNSSSALPHGLFSDGFYEMQPILVLTHEQYLLCKQHVGVQKDCAIFVQVDHEAKSWEKICYINISNEILKKIVSKYNGAHVQNWSFQNSHWQKIESIL